MTPPNLGVLFQQTVKRFPHKIAYRFKKGGSYDSLTWDQAAKKVDAAASWFLHKGIQAGDRIAILSENRFEWALIDLAAQTIGAITVPIYTSLTPSEIQYLLQDSESSFIAVSNQNLFQKVQEVCRSLPALKGAVIFDAETVPKEVFSALPWDSIKNLESFSPHKDIENVRNSISQESLASIIYTSGTTGVPKGVMLTHANFITNLIFSNRALKMDENDVHISFLPLSHIFERMAGHYLMIYIGATIAYAESMDSVAKNILEVRPTFIMGVPRFYEKIKDRVSEKIGNNAFKKWLCRRINILKKRLGGRIRFCISGGAPLPKEVAEFFYDLGILIIEGYGLTETSPVISANREEKFKFGTVGIPLKEIEVKIADDGEIATKGPCVMKGYYHKPEETNAVLKDGWFFTGDLGRIDADGFLTITGRKKELIVTSGGKKIAPRAIEEMFEKDPAILRCVLFGDGRKFITALIVPRKEKIEEFARVERLGYGSYQELLKSSQVYHFLENRINELAAHLANFEKIKYFALLENDFTQEAGELTPTLKVKREAVLSRHKDRLLPFYSQEGAAR